VLRKRVMSRPSPSPPVSVIGPSHGWLNVFIFVFVFVFFFFVFFVFFLALLSLLVVAFFVLFSFAHSFFFLAFALLCGCDRSLGRMWRRCTRSLFRCCRRLGRRRTLDVGRRGRSAQLPRQWLRSRARGRCERKEFRPFPLRDQRPRHSLGTCSIHHIRIMN
jgi:hypothetical protein